MYAVPTLFIVPGQPNVYLRFNFKFALETPHFLAPFFPAPAFTASQTALVVAQFKPVTFAKDQLLLTPGKTAEHYWFLETGWVRSFAVDPGGNDRTTQFYGPGGLVIDWPSFLLRQPSGEHFQALVACTAWQLDYEAFQQLFDTMPAFREAGRARLVANYFALQQHHLSRIVDPAKERYLRLLREHPQLVQQVPLRQIASYLDVTDTSLSRIRRELARG
jgi:CRP-like cAMP-binding protein